MDELDVCPQAHRFNPDILKSYEGREEARRRLGGGIEEKGRNGGGKKDTAEVKKIGVMNNRK